MGYILQSFPLLYLNLGGELLYIIEQRLQAQDIATEKSEKVLNDLLSTMLNRQFLGGIFRPERQNSTSKFDTMKSLMENIAHSSIMRLGQDSFDKLYDLMAMSIKFQFMAAPDAQSLLAITINHVDSWIQLTEDPEIMLQIQYSKDLLMTHYAKLSPWAWMTIRHSLLNHMQPCKTRVTVFLNRELQSQAGYFYSDNKGPLPEGIILPQLALGNSKPYKDFKCNESVINLGINMFNDNQRPPFRAKGFELQRIITNKPTTNAKPNTANVGHAIVEGKVDSIELELKAISTAAQDTVHVVEETLLDLFDQASISDK